MHERENLSQSRRDFIKTTIVAGAAAALPALPAFASPNAPGDEPLGAQDGGTVGSSSSYTRGIGIYPGNPADDFSPDLVIDTTSYRNLALLRPAFHSSSYDYNLTAQLITDGIKDTRLPQWVACSLESSGMLPKQDREVFLDHFPANVLELKGIQPQFQLELGGGEEAPAVDRIAVFAVVPDHIDPADLAITISASDDGRLWNEVGSVVGLQPLSPENYPPDLVRGTQLFYPSIPLKEVTKSRNYRIECGPSPNAADTTRLQWKVGQVAFFRGDGRVQVGGPYNFTSAWMAAGYGEEWVYVDLGAPCQIDRIALYWIARASAGSIQISHDAHIWQDLHSLAGMTGLVDDIKLDSPTHARYVRVLMTQPATANGYILSELEVYGRGGFVTKAKPMPAPTPGRVDLSGGTWRVQRSSLISADGATLSKPGYRDSEWVTATVPGTVLTSYYNAGAIPDPNFGQNQLHISDSFFYSDFWYRCEFTAPTVPHGDIAWLNFDGINWKADVYLNGEKIGRIEGGFIRARFDVTGKLLPGKSNALAVSIEKEANPGSAKQKTYEIPSKNGGAPGADAPTYHASVGWDWIPTIRGRNTGIWGSVFVTTTGPVTIEDPCVTTTLPLHDTSRADIGIEVDLENHSSKPINGILRGRFGTLNFEHKVTAVPSSRTKVKLDPSLIPALRLQNPQLWWPVGYGDPHLYDVELTFEAKRGKPLDSKSFKAGIRQMTANEDGGKLRLFINGRRFIASGGNWGFSESMLRYRAREYDTAIRYHREMNFTMVRNWVGQIGDDAFYDACDRHGVVVWQDFWLANPWDGPIPENNAMFLDGARDLILRIRNHASMGLYCGRNEGYPPKPLEAGIRKLLAELHPSLHYIPSSADDVVSGHGPYQALPLTLYFDTADSKLHSEIGSPNIPPIESVRAMMPESAIWPQGLDWGLHDFCLGGAQGGSSYLGIVEESYGGAHSAEEWIGLAQFVNYEGYRAMFEAQSKYRMGLLLWMSHPCWPSFVWQTYDYYFEPTATYYACKKACEPLHIQWNRTTEIIEVVNYSAGNMSGLTALAEVFNMDGTKMGSKSAALDSTEDSTAHAITMEYPKGLTHVHFLKLTLTRGSEIVSSNFYLRGLEEGNYRAIRQLPQSRLHIDTKAVQQGTLWHLTTQIKNTSTTPALMTRLKAVRAKTGDRILPAIYSDNYIALLPGETQIITTELNEADTRGEKPAIVVSGFNATIS
jgi:beta-galactosidase/beta-glucuronidase